MTRVAVAFLMALASACAPRRVCVAPARPPPISEPAAEALYRQTLATYGGMPMFEEWATLITTEHTHGQSGEMVNANVKTFRVSFERPGRFRFLLHEGFYVEEDEAAFVAVDPKGVWTAREEDASRALGREALNESELPLDSASEGMVTFYWRLLSGRDPLGASSTVRRLGRELVGARVSTHLVVTSDTSETELWIDDEKHLVRKVLRRALRRWPDWKKQPTSVSDLEDEAAHRATFLAHYREPALTDYLETVVVGTPTVPPSIDTSRPR